MTKTYNSTNSAGKLDLEENYLIPALKLMTNNINDIGISISLMGHKDGAVRHVNNMSVVGIPISHQIYVENDLIQYINAKQTMDDLGVEYLMDDFNIVIQDYTNDKLRTTILDYDATESLSGTNTSLIKWFSKNNHVDIMIQVISLREKRPADLDPIFELYNIDMYLPYMLKVAMFMKIYCANHGFNCAWRKYTGRGDKSDSKRGQPMICFIISRYEIPKGFSTEELYIDIFEEVHRNIENYGYPCWSKIKRYYNIADIRTIKNYYKYACALLNEEPQ